MNKPAKINQKVYRNGIKTHKTNNFQCSFVNFEREREFKSTVIFVTYRLLYSS